MYHKEGKILGKEAPTIDETIEEVDTETTDDLSATEQGSDTHTSPDENDDIEPQTQTSEDVLALVNQRLSALQDAFEQQIARNQNQQQMFNAIYGEMKDYKENALLESFHKPVIHNLIQFYDHFVSIEHQLNRISEPVEAFESWVERVSHGIFKRVQPQELADELSRCRTKLEAELLQFRTNLENLRFELEEVLYRMDVTPYEERLTKLDRKLHKTLKTLPTDNPDKDQEVAETHKIGFYWREEVFRPEEVTIFRYTQRISESKETADARTVGRNPTDEKGDETDG